MFSTNPPSDDGGVMEDENLLAGRPLRVFHRQSLWTPLEDIEHPDSFYNFSEEDYRRVVQAQDGTDAVLKTKAIRDQEEKEAAEKLGPVRIRYVFPEGLICETEFSALETVTEVFGFLHALVLEDLKEDAQLFTTPPKQLLTAHTLTLFRAKLVPAANLFVEFKESGTQIPLSVLRPNVLEMQEDVETDSTESSEAMDVEPEPVRVSGACTKRSASGCPSGTKKHHVPKWFRM